MKRSDPDTRFQTHIREPRWQQILSVVIVAVAVLGFLLLALFSDSN